MNKDTIKGKAKDIKGRVERQTGEWTGNPKMQVKGIADQVEGKVQNMAGKMKDAGKKAMSEMQDKNQRAKETREIQRDEERRDDEEIDRVESRSRKTA